MCEPTEFQITFTPSPAHPVAWRFEMLNLLLLAKSYIGASALPPQKKTQKRMADCIHRVSRTCYLYPPENS